jgi:hypothetical protein
MNNTPKHAKLSFRAPSARVTAALAAVMLAIGVAVGAAIGPAPSPSQANSSLPVLLGSLARIAAARAAERAAAAAAVQPPATEPEATPRRRRRKRHSRAATSATAEVPASTTTPTSISPAPKAKTPTSATKPSALPPATHVWLIELTGATFIAALAQPAAAPYIDTQAIPAGTLLSGWSGLDGGAFANETALLVGGSPQLLDTILQPPCPEGTAGAACTTETPGAITAADEFLEATVPTITSTPAFRESGLIVVTFASIGSATAAGLPAGATSATLTSQPASGVLLISPFAAVGARPTSGFNATSPKQSVEQLLRR